MNLPNETTYPIEADHISMCKFRSSLSNNYEIISGYLIEMVARAEGALDKREPPAVVIGLR